MEKNCPFCERIERKSRIIDETQYTLTILSNPSLVRGHCLVILKRHIEKLSNLSEKERRDLFSQVIKTEELLLKKYTGCDVRQNYRPFIPLSNLKVNHLHFHLIPRESMDELYSKCQIYEKEIFRELSQRELDEIENYILG